MHVLHPSNLTWSSKIYPCFQELLVPFQNHHFEYVKSPVSIIHVGKYTNTISVVSSQRESVGSLERVPSVFFLDVHPYALYKPIFGRYITFLQPQILRFCSGPSHRKNPTKTQEINRALKSAAPEPSSHREVMEDHAGSNSEVQSRGDETLHVFFFYLFQWFCSCCCCCCCCCCCFCDSLHVFVFEIFHFGGMTPMHIHVFCLWHSLIWMCANSSWSCFFGGIGKSWLHFCIFPGLVVEDAFWPKRTCWSTFSRALWDLWVSFRTCFACPSKLPHQAYRFFFYHKTFQIFPG